MRAVGEIDAYLFSSLHSACLSCCLSQIHFHPLSQTLLYPLTAPRPSSTLTALGLLLPSVYPWHHGKASWQGSCITSLISEAPPVRSAS